ncbi:ethanolamine utilization protein [Desulfosporosinus acidiphilus SJ4]|uniref:Ethanolamine utilization protein n=1 Tax=Desulfosporosinus acidiphilus (strain DSM 22704 / JCM 16185 / SJ4) TaxID=646529 RepID=I4D460_DESAJ|nr:cupin domain-containing protein [Desulfosporosinus acidiphilus]AFM40584.1 ethanolamine utilization protein [Desulfosporosinus acidiphilus SJ4]
MKKLVSANEIKTAAEKGQKLFYVDGNTIITPSAKDLAKELGVEFSTCSTAAEDHSCNTAGTQKNVNLGTELNRDVIYQVVKAVLTNKFLQNISGQVPESPFLSESEPKSGLKIVRGRSVNFETFDTGNPNTNVAYREVVSKNDSQMSAGFLTIEKSSFDWELCYEEIDIILEGSLSITINEKTYEACQGDVLFVPKGSKVTWSSSSYVKLFYVTYPANWPDLMAQ